ncbi:hypothetical protein ACSFCK_07200 [Brevibacterium luteolum]|uniref:hypothetical protein n=1 Tax=Brevibacterium luteolum TaxID=199591 RepID=UPI003EEA9000
MTSRSSPSAAPPTTARSTSAPLPASAKSRHIRIRPTEVTGRSLRFGPEPEAEPDVTC